MTETDKVCDNDGTSDFEPSLDMRRRARDILYYGLNRYVNSSSIKYYGDMVNIVIIHKHIQRVYD